MDEAFLPRLKKITLVEDFIRRFEEMILSGKLAVGDKLPSERELASRLSVSRPVVHEGLINLAAKGLITRSPNGGAVVNDYRTHGSISMLNTILNFQSGQLEPKLARDITDLRMLLEIENARLAALNRTDEQLSLLGGILKEESQINISDIEAVALLDFKFHHTIAIATNNIFYPLLVNSFKPLYLNGSEVFFSDLALTPEVFDFHKRLVQSIADQDSKKAIEIMTMLLEHGMTNYFTLASKFGQ
ncbi:MAG: FadR family transcriptional regulator [Anaerolineaceae bacterium]|nr:FadR family transcriptional regulator [Anaerolineaceae bacterium]